MASRGLGSLTLDLVLKTGAFEGPLDKATRNTQQKMGAIQKSVDGAMKGVIKSFAAFGAGVLSVQAVFQGFKNAIDQADKLNDFSIRLGASAEAVSAWGYAASQTGTDIDALGKGLLLLQKNMAKALDPKSTQSGLFKALGVDVKDAKGQLKELEDILPEILDKFNSLDNDATETALAMQLFGKSGADLREFLNLGSEGLSDFTAKARELGIVLSQETLSAADNFNDAIGDLKTATQGAIFQALQPLLPVLQQLVSEMVEFAKTGDGAKRAGEEAANGITQIGKAASSVYGFLVSLKEGLSAFEQQARGYTTLVLGGGASSIAQIEQSAKRLNAVFEGTFNASKAGKGAADPIDARLKVEFKSLDQQAKDIAEATKKRDALQKAVNGYLGNPTGKTDAAKKTGKSEAEKDAERLQKAYESLNDRLKEQMALIGTTGEAARVRYEVEQGELSKLTQAQKEELILRAENLDTMERQQELQKAADAEVRKQSEAFEEHNKQVKEQIADMEFENQLISMSNRDRQVATELRYAGVEAMSEEGQKISELVDANIQLSESYGFVADAKDDLADAFSDFITGAKSAKEAFGDFADSIYKRAIQLLADKAVNALFEAFSGTGASATGSSGAGGWGALFSSFFGGARAGGGNVNSGMMYAVNERGPELLSVGNRDYLMMGSQSGRVTPNSNVTRGARGGSNITIMVQPTSTRRTAQQIATETERVQSRDTYRNR